ARGAVHRLPEGVVGEPVVHGEHAEVVPGHGRAGGAGAGGGDVDGGTGRRTLHLGGDGGEQVRRADRVRVVDVVGAGGEGRGEGRGDDRAAQGVDIDHRVQRRAVGEGGRQLPQQTHESGDDPAVARAVDQVGAQDEAARFENVPFGCGPGGAGGGGRGDRCLAGAYPAEGASAVD